MSASSLILSRIGRGMRMLITQSDLLNALYAAYSFNKDSMFITNNCCITFGMYNPLYRPQYRGHYNELYQCKYNCQYKYIYVCNYVCVVRCVGDCVVCVFNLIFTICAYKIWTVYLIGKGFLC